MSCKNVATLNAREKCRKPQVLGQWGDSHKVRSGEICRAFEDGLKSGGRRERG